MRAVVTGMITTYPVGGVAWDYGQYAVALEDLGFEVYYLEDTGCPTYDPAQRLYGEDCNYGVRFLRDSLAALSPRLAERWHFRDASGECYGLSKRDLNDVIAGAELFLNVSGGTLLRDEYISCRCKVLVDTDPGWNHFVNYPRWDAQPGWQNTHGYRRTITFSHTPSDWVVPTVCCPTWDLPGIRPGRLLCSTGGRVRDPVALGRRS